MKARLLGLFLVLLFSVSLQGRGIDTCIVFKVKIVDENGIPLGQSVVSRYEMLTDSLGVCHIFAPPGAKLRLFFIGKKSVELQLPQVSNSGTTIVMEDEPTENSIITVKRTAPGKISRDIDVYPEPAPAPEGILDDSGMSYYPSYPGGPAEMFTYIAKKVNVDRAVELGMAGTVICDVCIDREGFIYDVKLIQGVDSVLDNAVIAALRQMSRWSTGRSNGQRISMKMRVPFKLEITEQEFVDNYHLMPSSDKQIK